MCFFRVCGNERPENIVRKNWHGIGIFVIFIVGHAEIVVAKYVIAVI